MNVQETAKLINEQLTIHMGGGVNPDKLVKFLSKEKGFRVNNLHVMPVNIRTHEYWCLTDKKFIYKSYTNEIHVNL